MPPPASTTALARMRNVPFLGVPGLDPTARRPSTMHPFGPGLTQDTGLPFPGRREVVDNRRCGGPRRASKVAEALPLASDGVARHRPHLPPERLAAAIEHVRDGSDMTAFGLGHHQHLVHPFEAGLKTLDGEIIGLEAIAPLLEN